jgi:lysine-specific demethylase 3
VAYSSANTPKEGTTNLHVDISDAVNLLIYAASSKEESDSQKDEKPTTRVIDKTMLSLLEKSGCSSDQVERFKSGEIPGALWHIFKPKDADEIRSFLVKVQNTIIIQ